MKNYQAYKEVDFKHIWHPFTQSNDWFNHEPLIVERGEGMYLYDTEGRKYLDGISALWCNVHRHNVPELTNAICEQASNFAHSTMLGCSHRPIIELTEALIPLLAPELSRIFYADSGSNAVEAGLRIALEYWQKNGQNKKTKVRLVSLVDAYHGDTLGSVGVGYSENFHAPLKHSIREALRVPAPHMFRFYENESEKVALEKSITAVNELFKEKHADIAAFILEPLVQGAAGIWTQPYEYLQAIASLCKEYDILLILDEVATGFGKTGALFAHQLGDVVPDILIMAKGLSAGYSALSAVAVKESIFSAFDGEPEERKTFFYGQTFAGNAIAASVALANIKLLKANSVLETLPARIKYLHNLIDQEILALNHVDEVRKTGVMIGIELTENKGKRQSYPSNQRIGMKISEFAREHGVIIRSLGNVIVLMPAVAMQEGDLEKLVRITALAIKSVTEQARE